MCIYIKHQFIQIISLNNLLGMIYYVDWSLKLTLKPSKAELHPICHLLALI